MTDEEREILIQQRRATIRIVAADGVDAISDQTDREDVINYVLQAICTELAGVSIEAEETTAPALRVLGAMVGGLFGIGNEATDNEIMVKMHERGSEIRSAIGYRVG